MNSPQYRRVSSDEATSSNPLGVHSPTRSNSGNGMVGGRSINDRIADKFFALAWVIAAVFTAYWTNFFSIILSSKDANRVLLTLAFACLAVNTGLTLYLTVYLPKIKKLKDASAWNVYCPKVIPIIVLTGVVCALLLIRGTWPVWGFYAPLILGVETMGFLFSFHFIPWKSAS